MKDAGGRIEDDAFVVAEDQAVACSQSNPSDTTAKIRAANVPIVLQRLAMVRLRSALPAF